MKTVDFIIPHMGRTELLVRTVESILAQSAIETIQEIIVVTKNQSPLPTFRSEKVKVLYKPDARTISEQRNIGADSSHADYVAFLDADIELAINWLETCINLLDENTERVLVSAMQKTSDHPTQVEWLRTTLSNVALDSNVGFLPGRNLLLSRASHKCVGGFPEHLQTCEDYCYTDKLAQLGDLYYTSATSYVHLGEDKNLQQTFSKEIWRSEYNLKSLLGRSIPLREWPSILLPFWVFAFSLLSLSGLIVPVLLAPSLALMLLPSALYASRLLRYRPAQLNVFFPYVFYVVYFWARAIGTVFGIRHLFQKPVQHGF